MKMKGVQKMSKKEFTVTTPVGDIVVYAKDEGGSYPGIFIEFYDTMSEPELVACVEYDDVVGQILTTIYSDVDSDEPTEAVYHGLK